MARSALVTRRGLATALVDVSLATCFLAFVVAHADQFASTRRPSHAVIVVTELLFAFFFVVRRPAESASRSTWDWLSAAGGTLAPLLLRPAAGMGDLVAGQVLQFVGAAGALLGILALNRSLGVVPACREIKSRGAYRVVRHPLYASYTVASIGYLVSNPSAWNVAAVALSFALQVVRIHNEERWLARVREYRAYMARTRWRMVPFLY